MAEKARKAAAIWDRRLSAIKAWTSPDPVLARRWSWYEAQAWAALVAFAGAPEDEGLRLEACQALSALTEEDAAWAGDAGRGAEVIEGFLARDFDPPLDPSLLLDLHAALRVGHTERRHIVPCRSRW